MTPSGRTATGWALGLALVSTVALGGCLGSTVERSTSGPATGAPSTATPTGSASTGPAASKAPATPDAPATPATPSTSAAPRPAAQQARLDERLRAAAWANDVPAGRRLIQRGADVNATDDTQQSAYLIATSEGHLDLLELTLRHGARVNAKDSWNGTGLIRAAERGHAAVVGRLLRAGVAPHHVNRIGYQAAHEAVWLGEDTPAYRTTLRVLAAGGVRWRVPSVREGLTPRQMADRRGFTGLAATLDAITKADVRFPDAALLEAARTGDADRAAAALRAGADLNVRDSGDMNRTPLLVAANHDSVAVAEVLLAMGADVDAVDDQQDTAWLVTGVTGSVPMGRTLLTAHPDLSATNRYGGLSPIPAAERGHLAYLEWVVGTDVDLNHRNDLGWTALLEAIVLGDGSPRYQRIVEVLLAAGADPTITDHEGRDARALAVQHRHPGIVRVLDRADSST